MCDYIQLAFNLYSGNHEPDDNGIHREVEYEEAAGKTLADELKMHTT